MQVTRTRTHAMQIINNRLRMVFGISLLLYDRHDEFQALQRNWITRGSLGSARSREWKKSRDNLPSPRTRCSSPNPKKGMSITNRSTVKVRIPFRVPPPKSAILWDNDCPW